MDCPLRVKLVRLVTLIALFLNRIEYSDSILSSEWNPYCWGFECCNEEWIHRNVTELRKNLSESLYGQHLVEDTLVRSLSGHVTYGSDKPLVFSFHGSCGTGKSFVSKLIAKSWFTLGTNSKFFNLMIGTKDFPFKSETSTYKRNLQTTIEEQVRKCPYQLFVFEEVDSFPPGLLDGLTPFLTSYDKVDGVDYRKSIFILISNTGQQSICKLTEKGHNSGLERESVTIKEMEEVLESELYLSSNTGLSNSKLIDKFFISYFIPFLPLERKHVRKCVIKTLQERVGKSFDMDLVDDVMDELSFRDPDENFSQKGCKNVDEKVNYILGGRTFERKVEL